jgi:hypothetical protein
MLSALRSRTPERQSRRPSRVHGDGHGGAPPALRVVLLDEGEADGFAQASASPCRLTAVSRNVYRAERASKHNLRPSHRVLAAACRDYQPFSAP